MNDEIKPLIMDYFKYQVGTKRVLRPLQYIREQYELTKKRKEGTFAQHGEDVFLVKLFSAETRRGNYIDIGANHPFIINNTYLLYKKYGWRGINVEPNTYLWSRLKYFRPEDINLNIGIGSKEISLLFYHFWPSVSSTFSPDACIQFLKEGKRLINVYPIEVKPVMWILKYFEKIDQSIAIDLLSIDTEGFEYEIIKGIDFSKFRPKVIVLENSGHGSDTAEEMQSHLKDNQYNLLTSLGCNDFYIDLHAQANLAVTT